MLRIVLFKHFEIFVAKCVPKVDTHGQNLASLNLLLFDNDVGVCEAWKQFRYELNSVGLSLAEEWTRHGDVALELRSDVHQKVLVTQLQLEFYWESVWVLMVHIEQARDVGF